VGLIEDLSAGLASRPRRVIGRELRAAVLVPIVDDGGPERLILTRRSDDLPTHQGQVAFPGGYIKEGEGPEATALREAKEEIGLPPTAVQVVGLLDDFCTWDDTVAVTSVACRIGILPPLVAEPAEVARVFEIPVAALARPQGWTWMPNPVSESPARLWYFEHDGETLWGLSARIVISMLERAGLPSPRPGSS
jgi:8-oxo-dGTP pyrophosphatase MutT (NUDIX family)